MGLVPPDDKARILRNEFRSIKAPILLRPRSTKRRDPQHVSVAAVVSSLPGEGQDLRQLNLRVEPRARQRRDHGADRWGRRAQAAVDAARRKGSSRPVGLPGQRAKCRFR